MYIIMADQLTMFNNIKNLGIPYIFNKHEMIISV